MGIFLEHIRNPLEEILLEDVRLQRRSRLARHDEHRILQIDRLLHRLHLFRIGRIQDVQRRVARLFAERHRGYFRTQARPAHPQQQCVRESLALYFFLQIEQRLHVRDLAGGNPEPSHPLRFVRVRPQARVHLPQPRDLVVLFPIVQGLLNRLVVGLGQGIAHVFDLRRWRSRVLFDRSNHLFERLAEQTHAIHQQVRRDLVHRNAGFGQRIHRRIGFTHALRQRDRRIPVIAKRVQRCRRDGVDRVRPDQ